jgi:hypothetical protein
MNDGMEQQGYCIDKNVPFLALDLLARIVPVRTPPCCGRNGRGSGSSISVPPSNQATILESQMIHMIQELFGQTLGFVQMSI